VDYVIIIGYVHLGTSHVISIKTV